MTTHGRSPVAGWSALWWQRLPAQIAQYSVGFGSALTDGIHLVRWRPLAAMAPAACLVVGAALAVAQTGPAFTGSLVIVGCVVLLGLSGVQLGLWAWLGYVVANLPFGEHAVGFSTGTMGRSLGTATSVVMNDALLGVLAVGIPFALLAVRIEVRSLGWHRWIGDAGEALLYSLAAAASYYLWVQALPVLVRPVFTLQGAQPTPESIEPLQRWWGALTILALLGSAGRVLLERRAVGPAVLTAIRDANQRFTSLAGSRRLPPALMRVLAAAGSTLLLLGLVSNAVQAAITFAAVLVLLALRDRIRDAGWLQPMATIPLFVRYAIGVMCCVVITRLTLAVFTRRLFGIFVGWTTDSFVPAWLAVLASVTVIILLTAPVRAVPAASPAAVEGGRR